MKILVFPGGIFQVALVRYLSRPEKAELLGCKPLNIWVLDLYIFKSSELFFFHGLFGFVCKTQQNFQYCMVYICWSLPPITKRASMVLMDL